MWHICINIYNLYSNVSSSSFYLSCRVTDNEICSICVFSSSLWPSLDSVVSCVQTLDAFLSHALLQPTRHHRRHRHCSVALSSYRALEHRGRGSRGVLFCRGHSFVTHCRLSPSVLLRRAVKLHNPCQSACVCVFSWWHTHTHERL